jgi:hypothetical protein
MRNFHPAIGQNIKMVGAAELQNASSKIHRIQEMIFAQNEKRKQEKNMRIFAQN